MIRWLVQSVHDCPALAQGEAPPDWLSQAESAHLARLVIPKRRQDWLLGRWTAKHLVAAYLGEQGGTPRLKAITIANDPSGAPFAYLEPNQPDSRIPISLTISHSGGISFCALVAQSRDSRGLSRLPSVGGDVEQIEPRSQSFVRDFFTAEEQAALTALSPELHDRRATAIWSAKEAALKSLHLGLSVDTRLVSVSYEEDAPLRHEPPRDLPGSFELPGRSLNPTRLSTFCVSGAESEALWARRRQPYDSSDPNLAPVSGWTPVSIALSGAAARAAVELAAFDYKLAAWQRILTTDAYRIQYVLTLCTLAQIQLSEMAAAASSCNGLYERE